SIQPAGARIDELVVKAREYTSSQNKEKALETLNQALELLPSLNNVQTKAELVRDIVITPDGDTSLLEKLVALYVEAEQKEQLSSVLAKVLPVTQSLSSGYSFIKTSALSAIAYHYATIGQPQKSLEILPQSLQVANSLQGAEFKLIALIEIAETYLAAGQREPVPAILAQSLQLAQTFEHPNPYRKAEVLGRVAIAYAQAGEYDQALDISKTIENPSYYRANVLAVVANQYAQNGQIEQALQLAQSLDADEFKVKTLRDIALSYVKAGEQDKASDVFSQSVESARSLGETLLADTITQYAAAGQLETALSAAQTINDAESKAKALSAIALLYAKAGQQTQASQILSQAIESAKAIQGNEPQGRVLKEMIDNYLKVGRYEDAFQVAQAIQADTVDLSKTAVLINIITKTVEAGQNEQALQITQLLDKGDIEQRNFALQRIALGYAKAGQFDKAIQTAEMVNNAGSTYFYQARTLAAIANEYLKTGQTNRANELYTQAIQVANSLEIPSNKAEALAAIALEYTLSGQQDKASLLLSQALQVAQTQQDNSYILQAIADEYIKAQQYDVAFKVAQAMRDSYEKTNKLQEIVSKYLETGRYDDARQFVNIYEAPAEKVGLLLAIANKYIQTGQTTKANEVLAQAFQIAKTIEGPESNILVFKVETDSQGNRISATEVDDPADRGSLLEEIAVKYAQAGQYNQALQVAQALESTATRNQLNQRLACYR
ncbi:MAG: hypothetical protein F6K28_35705, partial [Microcoleus sp. SIO2G3]|nr:hypothetical protein [Microcoleus sp. SIO2G3]